MLTVGSLFAGCGMGDVGLSWAGFEHRWFSEIEPFCCECLSRLWPDCPNLGDITKIDWSTVEPVDVLVGGFPCQPHSVAGKQGGIEDDRWLWPAFAAAIRAIRPSYVIIENVPGLLRSSDGGAIRAVFGDLAALGYDAEWQMLRASDFGAPHKRERIVIVAYRDSPRQQQPSGDFTEGGRWAGDSSNVGHSQLPRPSRDGADFCATTGCHQAVSQSGRSSQGFADQLDYSNSAGLPGQSASTTPITDSHGTQDGLPEPRSSDDVADTCEPRPRHFDGAATGQGRQPTDAYEPAALRCGNRADGAEGTDPSSGALAHPGCAERRQGDTEGRDLHDAEHCVQSDRQEDSGGIGECGEGLADTCCIGTGEPFDQAHPFTRSGNSRTVSEQRSTRTEQGIFQPIDRAKYNDWTNWRPLTAVRRGVDGAELGTVTRLVPDDPRLWPVERKGRPNRRAMLRAIGNGIVPQMMWYVGDCVMAHAGCEYGL